MHQVLGIFLVLVGIQAAPQVPCGVQMVQPVTNRIVGGQVATPGSWPWVVLISDSLGFISGSGVVVDQHVVVTSAQHFEGTNYNVFDLKLNLWRVYAGEYNISATDPNEKYYHIRRVVLHPGYNVSSLENDVALIILNDPIQWNDNTRPLCLPDPTTSYTVGEQCYLAGWGSTSSTGNEETLNQLMYPILDDSVCSGIWDDFLPGTEICAGYQNQTKDFCQDDIGSPLMCKKSNGAWYVQGLASSGGDCKTADKPGIFEDLSMYQDWIKATMEQANFPYQY
ncbi:vitamin K-dependent protein C-like isoform X2 [Mya arenaria]|nr:vitamin K-dependent protein C-like isoform X2 [Mya arenaria]XP_052789917.1 vitamin K-dependent protein C-like isoform X2 [Mya arenaria]XP_052789927.1 vitamin K-dependent protein C-like isoform X2 [Mya arenaria]